MIKIVVDSTADMPEVLIREYGITVVPLSVQFGDESLRDGVDISKMPSTNGWLLSSMLPKTSQPPIGAFEQVYRELSADGSPIVSIHLSGKLSGTLRAAQQAAALVEDAQIAVVDSGHIVMGMGYQAIAAARAAQAGKSLDACVAAVTSMIPRIFLYVGLDTLRYIQQGGRIGRVQAFLGTLLSVKPIIEVRGGEPLPLEQVRTTRRMGARLAELVQAQGPLEELAVLYTTSLDQAEALAEAIVSQGIFPRERLIMAQMGGVIGTHVGPSGVGINGVRR